MNDTSGNYFHFLRKSTNLTSLIFGVFRIGRKQQESAKWRPWTIVRRYLLANLGPNGPKMSLCHL